MLEIYDLKTEYLTNPVGIDSEHPRFSWKLKSDKKNVIQSSYHITIYNGEDVLWDSGMVKDKKSQRIKYQGLPLRSRMQLRWQVSVTAGDDSAKSNMAAFEMGLLQEEDWSAYWIEPENDIDCERRQPVPYLRREFIVKPGLAKARIYQTAHGLYETWFNGKLGSEDKFKPGLTSYYTRIQYQVSDITDKLSEGPNCWAVMLGDGWWRGVTGGTLKNNFGYKLHYLGQIELSYADGTMETIGTDEIFKTATGGLLASDMQMGEIYDLRLEPNGWKWIGFNDAEWRPVHKTSEHINAKKIASRSVPVLEKEEFSCRIFEDANGDRILDFGQNIAGYVKMRVRGCEEGQKIRLVHGEDLVDGCFSIENICHTVLPISQFQEITYTSLGLLEEEYTPFFAVFGFRYVKLEGYENTILPGDFTAVAVYSGLQETGSFKCSNPLVNKLVQNSMWSQKGNFLDVAVDCPTRERNAWTGDIQVYARTAADFMNVYPFFEKWLQDMSIEQYSSGKIGITFPSTSSFHNPVEFKKIAKLNPMAAMAGPEGNGSLAEDSTGWGDAAVWLPYMLYLCYGDSQILINQYNTARNWVNYMLSCAKEHNPVYEEEPQYHTYTGGELDADYIFDTKFHFGEWMEPIQRDENMSVSEVLAHYYKYGNPKVATAYMCRSCDNMAHMASILERKEDQEKYEQIASKIRMVYQKYMIEPDGTVEKGHQASYVRVLAMKLCSQKQEKKILDNLLHEIEANDYCLNTGFLSTPFLLHVLADYGYLETAYRILEQTKNPSWLHAVLLGSTTILESWDGMDHHAESFNHYSYGAVCNFLFSRVTGIEPEFGRPGYEYFKLAPLPGGTLTYAEAKYESIYGTICSSWKKVHDGIIYRFNIPVNTKAEIHLPDGQCIYKGSGEYEFKLYS